jgi:hypothetical protein
MEIVTMAFDHGQRRIMPLNVLLIVFNSILWWPSVTPYVIVPVAAVLLVLTLDKYLGMFIAQLVLIVLAVLHHFVC